MTTMIGSFPMTALAGFPNVDLDHEALDELVERVRTGSSASRG
jgi:hypothetical protein